MLRCQAWLVLGFVSLFVGCNSAETSNSGSRATSTAASKYLSESEPEGAKSVIDAMKSVQDGDELTLVGRIGGSQSPFVSGRAAFTVVDTSLVPCSERPGDSCPTPWDYCCDTDQLSAATAMVKIVDEQGQTVALDAEKELGLNKLQTVVVRGKAKRDESGNLAVLGHRVFIKK